METTKDYEKLTLLDFNRRGLNRNHINELKKSIEKNGYIGAPIVVNRDFEIIDGQHRFMALQEMRKEIPYIVADVDYSSIVDLNITHRNWGLDDYVHYYSTRFKQPDYIRLQRVCKDLATNATTVLAIARSSVMGGTVRGQIKDGTLRFTIDDSLRCHDFYENYKEVVKNLRANKTTRLCAALAELSTRKNFKWSTMIDKSKKYPTLFYNCRTVAEFIVMLLKIYNFNTRLETQKLIA